MQKWVIFLYMAGDNNLSGAGEEDIEELCRIGSSDQATFVVEFDSAGTYRETIRYEISKPNPAGKSHPIIVEKMGETDSGNPKTLAAFLLWGIKTYPADNYFLILWNHGGGFKYRMILDKLNIRRDQQAYLLDNTRHNRSANRSCPVFCNSVFLHPDLVRSTFDLESPKPYIKNIAWDDITGNSLDLIELKKSIQQGISEPDRKKLKILGFDACLMNMLEVVVQCRGLTDLVIASEETEPFAGWPYHTLAAYFRSARRLNPVMIGKKIVKLYREYYRPYPEEAVTLSAVSTSHLDDLCQAFSNWVEAFQSLIPSHLDLIFRIRQGVQSFTYTDYVDLGDLIRLTNQIINGSNIDPFLKTGIQESSRPVMNAYDQSVSASANSGGSVRYSSGLSIWFPIQKKLYQSNCRNYQKLDFCKTYPAWNHFLNGLFKSMER